MRKVAGEGFQVNKGHFFFYLHATDYDSKKIGKILLLIQINTVTLIEQTETKPPETLEFKLRKWMDNFTQLELEEGKWMLAVTNLEVYSSVLNITKYNNKIAIFTPEYGGDPESIKMLHGLLEERRWTKSNYAKME